MPKGGKRPGAGRPKGSKDPHTIAQEQAAQVFRELLIQRILEEKGEIIEALIKQAAGGNILAIRQVHDRILGKTTEKVDMRDCPMLILDESG